ncbi:MAG: hypothetical protein AAGI91_11650 [Bacteroidota bacterium]
MSTPPPPPDAPNHGIRALETLRERVKRAAAEIARLRSENARLASRVGELADLAGEAGGVTIEGEPAALREQVEDFIEAIDRMLAEPSPGEAVSDRAPGGSPD